MDSHLFIPYSIYFAQTKPPLVFYHGVYLCMAKEKLLSGYILHVSNLESYKTFIIFVLSKLPTIMVS
ncbi:hypothetical protein EZS27_043921, partial [termite gut metagenome]